jgi:hypothetical protein
MPSHAAQPSAIDRSADSAIEHHFRPYPHPIGSAIETPRTTV